MLSIIIPTYNEAAHIERLVRYLKQEGGDLVSEILVVDGGSHDDTATLAQHAGAKVLHSPVCSRAAQMNLGAKHANESVLYFVHADAFPPAGFARDIQEALEAGYQMGCFRYRFDSPRAILKFNAWFVRFQFLWCQGGDKTFFIRREVFDSFGGYDERFVVMEEYDFLQKAMKKHRLRIIPRDVVVSARKYEKNSWLRVQLANATAFTLFRFRVDPRRIRDTYKRMLR